jgi:ABC-type transporter Mla subunit MlaD
MHKTKNKRNKLAKKTRRYRKYYGGNSETSTNKSSEILKESEGIFDVIGDKLSGYTSSMYNYGKEKGLRLLGLQTINPAEATEDTNKINESVTSATETMNKASETVNKASEGVSKIGSDVVNVFDKGSAALIDNINDVLGSEIVNDSFKEASKDLGETSAKILHNFNEAVSTPEFKEETKVAIDNAAEIADIVIKSSEKPVNDAIDIINKSATDATAGVASGAVKVATDAMAAVPGYGAIIEVGKMANDISAAAGDVVEASTAATEAVSKAIKETSNNINEGFEKLEEAKDKMKNVTNVPSLDSRVNTQMVQQGGFKELVNEKYQVAGRISDSIDEFNNPIHFSSMKTGGYQYNKTKKYSMKSKGKSKRVRFSL